MIEVSIRLTLIYANSTNIDKSNQCSHTIGRRLSNLFHSSSFKSANIFTDLFIFIHSILPHRKELFVESLKAKFVVEWSGI